MIPDWCERTLRFGSRVAIVYGYDDEDTKKLGLCPLGTGHHAWRPSALRPWHWVLEPCSAARRQLDPADVPVRDKSDYEFCGGCGHCFQSGWHREEHAKVCPGEWWD
jgi:hypothetical protein